MKLQTLLICSGFLLSGTPLVAAKVHGPSKQSTVYPEGPKLKVLLEKDVSSAYMEARGAYRVIRKDSGTILSTGNIGKRFVVHALQDGLRWGEEYPEVYQISVVPLTKDACIFVNGIQYKGAMSIYHVRNNRITIVNEVPIEDFLKSTLAVQFDAPLPKEAMSAIAIAARTEAYRRVLKSASATRPWDITAEDADYYGFGVTQRDNGVDEAIDWTRYMVLESVKQKGPMQNIAVPVDKAEELALKGCDAQKILTNLYPQSKIGATIDADAVSIR